MARLQKVLATLANLPDMSVCVLYADRVLDLILHAFGLCTGMH